MSKIILFNMMSIDGFFEGTGQRIDWHNVDADFNDFAIEQLNDAAVLLFGRITYELMANYWPSADALANDPVVAGKMNSIPKIVFSKTLSKADWNNTLVAKENIEEVCKKLKQEYEKNIFIFGSADLASSFINLKLIDEYRLIINPVILGQGNPLFKLRANQLNLRFISARVFSSGNVLLFYRTGEKY